ncbi:hypothetical protein ILYODFUR_021500 [Ilyodon furcidens]|uniref:Uncharacterized protein n=1 Tax=Ilyodon furcidens TaxID=33524 RepID=A0ABV0UVF2_9TELE
MSPRHPCTCVSHIYAKRHFNHFVSCQERNVSQPRSSLKPGVPFLTRLPLTLPSGSIQPPAVVLCFYSIPPYLFLSHQRTPTGLLSSASLMCGFRGNGIAGMLIVPL